MGCASCVGLWGLHFEHSSFVWIHRWTSHYLRHLWGGRTKINCFVASVRVAGDVACKRAVIHHLTLYLIGSLVMSIVNDVILLSGTNEWWRGTFIKVIVVVMILAAQCVSTGMSVEVATNTRSTTSAIKLFFIIYGTRYIYIGRRGVKKLNLLSVTVTTVNYTDITQRTFSVLLIALIFMRHYSSPQRCSNSFLAPLLDLLQLLRNTIFYTLLCCCIVLTLTNCTVVVHTHTVKTAIDNTLSTFTFV